MVRVGINGMYRFNRLRIWSEGVYTALREYNFNSGALTGLLATDYRTQRFGILAAECYYTVVGMCRVISKIIREHRTRETDGVVISIIPIGLPLVLR